jgi:adenosylcobinamide-GDP ribazoletransferase
VQNLAAACKFLTIWSRFAAIQPSGKAIGSAMIYFPVVGLALGLILALLNYSLAPYLPSEILSIVLMTVLILSTGGIHLEDLRATFDVAPTKTTSIETRRNGSLGFVAIVMVLLFKSAAIDSMDERLTVSLLVTPVLARWAVMIFSYGYHDRCEEVARVIAEQVRFWHLLVATAATLALSVYCLGRKGLWIALSLSLFALLARSLLYRVHSNLTQHNFGAMIELGETLSLVLLASL